MPDDKHNQAWDEIDKVLKEKRVSQYFDNLYCDIKRFYAEFSFPNG